ncbi:MAG: hypothetical protein AB1344_04025 [Pseudomonadota bacterium]
MIALGAWGWRHSGWVGAFYPEELPEEWRLTFYANEYEVVGLRADDWLKPELDSLRGWVNDTREGFLFVLELPEALPADVDERLAILTPRLGGLLAGEGEPVGLDRFAPIWPVSGAAHNLVEALEVDRPPLALLEAGKLDLRAARLALESLGGRGDAIILLDDGPELLERLSALRTLRDLLGWQ